MGLSGNPDAIGMDSENSQEAAMMERVTRWYCAHFHKGVIWKQDGYECPVCFRRYQVPWDSGRCHPRPQPEMSGIERFFAQMEAQYFERLEVEMATRLDNGSTKVAVGGVPGLWPNRSNSPM
jgi:hypothetical protein